MPDGVTVIHGDCLEILPTLDPSVHCIVTDPPYGLDYSPETSTQMGIQRFPSIEGDDRPFDITPFLGFPDVIAWCLPQLTVGIPVGMGVWYAWDKVTKNDLSVWISECEFAWHKRGTKTRMFRHLWSGFYRGRESGRRSLHPTQKPVALMTWCLSFLPPDAVVLDPYAGSGTTGVACLKAGRKCILIESDERYIPIINRRLESAATPLFAGIEEP